MERKENSTTAEHLPGCMPSSAGCVGEAVFSSISSFMLQIFKPQHSGGKRQTDLCKLEAYLLHLASSGQPGIHSETMTQK